ncbi:hypothetical protein [Microbacterium sp.]|nr:hypothetical protein [Microbacterium sp.]
MTALGTTRERCCIAEQYSAAIARVLALVSVLVGVAALAGAP